MLDIDPIYDFITESHYIETIYWRLQ
jgi:hypothetical protein